MASSQEEILEAFKPFIEMGLVGIDNCFEEEKNCRVKYNKLGTREEIFTENEMFNLPQSKMMQEAIKNGCKTNEQVIDYCDKKKEIIKNNAKEVGEAQISDTIGCFFCKDPYEECSCDIIYEMVTPNGEFLYKREHCY